MSTKTEQNALPALMTYDSWLKSIPASSTTGWRWRREKMVETINIAGRVYISREAIARFLSRAAAGEFEKRHVVPTRAA